MQDPTEPGSPEQDDEKRRRDNLAFAAFLEGSPLGHATDTDETNGAPANGPPDEPPVEPVGSQIQPDAAARRRALRDRVAAGDSSSAAEQGAPSDQVETLVDQPPSAGPADQSGSAKTSSLPPAVGNFVDYYLAIAKPLVLSPRVFFENMPQTGGYKEPAIFMAASCGVYAVGSAIFNLKLLELPQLFLIAFLGRCLAAGIAFGASKAMGIKEASPEPIFRIWAYASCLALPGILPFVGSILDGATFVYSFVLYYFGLKKVLQTTKQKTLQVVFVSAVLSALGMGALLVIGLLRSVLKDVFGV